MVKNLNEEKVTARLKNLAKLIKKYNLHYHQKDNPLITDEKFDNLTKENNDLEKKYPHLIL